MAANLAMRRCFAWTRRDVPAQAIKSGFTVLYRSIFDLVRDFLSDEALGGQDKTLERYLRPDLVINDVGMKQLPKRSGDPSPTPVGARCKRLR